MKVRELIEILEEMPPDFHVVSNDVEVTEVLIRDELYFTENQGYDEGLIVKIY